MSIKFTCSCGKRLRAPESLATKRTVCPRCGNPVGIPPLHPPHPGAAGHMTPAERLRHRKLASPLLPITPPSPATVEPSADRSLSPALPPRRPDFSAVRLLTAQKAGRLVPHEPPRLETRWYECLVYPIRAAPLVFGPAVVLTGLTLALARLLPQALADLQTESVTRWLFAGFGLLILLVVVGYPCAFLDCVLASAATGEARFIRWPGLNLRLVVRSAAAWLVSFLAGPALFLVVALLYWLYGGDFKTVDWLILAELAVVALTWLILALLSVNYYERLRDANPLAVADLVEHLGLRVVAVALATAVVALGHLLLLASAVKRVHQDLGYGTALLLLGWTSGLFWATFFFRLLGLWCYRARG